MPEAVAHLGMMLGEDMPFNIVHTGSQKPISEDDSDAP